MRIKVESVNLITGVIFHTFDFFHAEKITIEFNVNFELFCSAHFIWLNTYLMVNSDLQVKK